MKISFTIPLYNQDNDYNPYLDPSSIEGQLGLENEFSDLAHRLQANTNAHAKLIPHLNNQEDVWEFFLAPFDFYIKLKSFKSEMQYDLMLGSFIQINIEATLRKILGQNDRDELENKIAQHLFYNPHIISYEIEIEPYLTHIPVLAEIEANRWNAQSHFIKFLCTNEGLRQYILKDYISNAESLYITDENKELQLFQYQLNSSINRYIDLNNPLHLLCLIIQNSSAFKIEMLKFDSESISCTLTNSGNFKVQTHNQVHHYFTKDVLHQYALRQTSGQTNKNTRPLPNPSNSPRPSKRVKKNNITQQPTPVPTNYSAKLFQKANTPATNKPVPRTKRKR